MWRPGDRHVRTATYNNGFLGRLRARVLTPVGGWDGGFFFASTFPLPIRLEADRGQTHAWLGALLYLYAAYVTHCSSFNM